jgi:hypothetical protein
LRNNSETNIVAVHVSDDNLQDLQDKLREAETRYGLQSGEAGLALMGLVEHLKKEPGNEETIRRLEERIEEIVEIYKDACE